MAVEKHLEDVVRAYKTSIKEWPESPELKLTEHKTGCTSDQWQTKRTPKVSSGTSSGRVKAVHQIFRSYAGSSINLLIDANVFENTEKAVAALAGMIPILENANHRGGFC